MTEKITINGREYSKPPKRFKSGHICTPNEAEALNALLIDRVKNNLSRKTEVISQIELEEYYQNYQLGIGPSKDDPIEIEARKIARVAIGQKLNEQGKTFKDLNKEELDRMIKEICQLDSVRKEAAKRIAVMEELLMEDLGD